MVIKLLIYCKYSYNIDTAKFNSLPNYFKSGFHKQVTGQVRCYKSHIYLPYLKLVSLVSNTVNTVCLIFYQSAGYDFIRIQMLLQLNL